MAHIVWLIGALMAVTGIAALFKPVWMRQMLILVNKGRLVYAVAAVKIVIGVIFLILATQCRMPKVIIALGILTAGGSILFCLLPFAKIRRFMNWWIARPLWLYRVWGVAATLVGGLSQSAGVAH